MKKVVTQLKKERVESTQVETDDVVGVKVYVRLRPLVQRELDEGEHEIKWKYNTAAILEDTGMGTKTRSFDSILPPESNNVDAYDAVAKEMIVKCMTGQNCTIFAYGQTGSGKTWTMMGDDDGKYPGIIPLALRDIFRTVMEKKRDMHYRIKVSFLEIYNEQINDLLNKNLEAGKNLSIKKDDSERGAVVGDLTEVVVESAEEALDTMERGNNSRKTAATKMNARSSRSHSVFRIIIESTPSQEKIDWEKKLLASSDFNDEEEEEEEFTSIVSSKSNNDQKSYSFLTLVDLAGSERVKSTGAKGNTLKEGAAINKSLSALGDVISKLGADGNYDGAHIPYRNSKLTRLLKHSLGGNSETAVVIAMTPAPMHTSESISSLNFGQICKKIQNKIKGAKMSKREALRKYKLQLMQLKTEMEAVRRRDEELLSEVQQLHQHDEELVHQVEELNHELHENKHRIDDVAYKAVESERTILKKRLHAMQEIFMKPANTAGFASEKNQFEYVLNVLLTETEGNDKVAKLVKTAVDEVGRIHAQKKEKNEKIKSESKEKFKKLRRLSMPIKEPSSTELFRGSTLLRISETSHSTSEAGGNDFDKLYKHSRKVHDRYEGQIDEWKEKNAELTKTINNLRDDTVEQTKELARAQATIERLEEELRSSNDVKIQLRDSQEDNARLAGDLKQLEAKSKQEQSHLRARQEGLQTDLNRSEDRCIELSDSMEALAEDNERIKAERLDMKNEFETQKVSILSLQSKLMNACASSASGHNAGDGRRVKARRMSVATVGMQWTQVEQAVSHFIVERKRLDEDISTLKNIQHEVEATKAKNRKFKRELEERDLQMQAKIDELKNKQLDLAGRIEDLDRRENALKKHEAHSLEKDILLSHRANEIEQKERYLEELGKTLETRNVESQQDQERNSSKEAELWKKEHELQLKSSKIDSATAIQRVIRQALLRKASANSKKYVLKLEEVEARETALKADIKRHREAAEEVHIQQVDLEYKHEDLNRRLQDFKERNIRIQRLHDDLMKREARQKEVEDELDTLTMECASERQHLQDWRQDLARQDADYRSVEKEVQALKHVVDEKLRIQRSDMLEIERQKNRLSLQQSMMKRQAQEIEVQVHQTKIVETRLYERESRLSEFRDESSRQRNEVRRLKQQISAREAAIRSTESRLEKEEKRIQKLEKKVSNGEEKAHEIELKYTQLERRERQLVERESEFYNKQAVAIVRKYKHEMNSLETQLELSVASAKKLKDANKVLKEQLADLKMEMKNSQNFTVQAEAVKDLESAKFLLENLKLSFESISPSSTPVLQVINCEKKSLEESTAPPLTPVILAACSNGIVDVSLE
jgi:centromeric protein E